MGCTSSKATSNESSTTGGKTLLKSHTAALNGDGAKTVCARDAETAAAPDEFNGSAEPAAEPPLDATEETGTKKSDSVDQDESQINARSGHEHGDTCVGRFQSLVSQTAKVEPEKPCDMIQRTASRTALREAIESNDVFKLRDAISQGENAKLPISELQPARQFLRDKEESQKALESNERRTAQGEPLVAFAKGDLVNIVGPAANGNVEYKGKTGRISHVDVGNIPYGVVVEKETAWFRHSSLEKPKSLKVTVTGNGKTEASCCAGNSGILGCCTDVRR